MTTPPSRVNQRSCWQTTDGELYVNHAQACAHQILIDNRAWYYSGNQLCATGEVKAMTHCVELEVLLVWLNQHRDALYRLLPPHPKGPSLKREALELLGPEPTPIPQAREEGDDPGVISNAAQIHAWRTINKALQALPS
jgi:hypothetical protein